MCDGPAQKSRGLRFDELMNTFLVFQATFEEKELAGPAHLDMESYRLRHVFIEAVAGDLGLRYGVDVASVRLPKWTATGSEGLLIAVSDFYRIGQEARRLDEMQMLAIAALRVLEGLAGELEAGRTTRGKRNVTPGPRLVMEKLQISERTYHNYKRELQERGKSTPSLLDFQQVAADRAVREKAHQLPAKRR